MKALEIDYYVPMFFVRVELKSKENNNIMHQVFSIKTEHFDKCDDFGLIEIFHSDEETSNEIIYALFTELKSYYKRFYNVEFLQYGFLSCDGSLDWYDDFPNMEKHIEFLNTGNYDVYDE